MKSILTIIIIQAKMSIASCSAQFSSSDIMNKYFMCFEVTTLWNGEIIINLSHRINSCLKNPW